MPLVVRTLVTAVALFVAAAFVPGISFESCGPTLIPDTTCVISVLLTALVLGLLNALVRPLLVLISMPVTCLTLGLFVLVINGVMLLLAAQLRFLGFAVDGLLPAIVGGIVVSVVSFVLNLVVRD